MGSPKKPIKVYVPVDLAVDKNGQMYPRTITWEDGRKYEIDRVLDVRPAPAARGKRPAEAEKNLAISGNCGIIGTIH